ncbi:MAG: RidA family protein [Elusimicrobiota bacterium]|jgi:2-iminobutanoate/2-iminopropanoate deaminase|nr:RidA family protein [Elusimicrobiota bacterium]
MEIINTQHAPLPIGPYSQGIIAGDFLFISGQIPIDPKTNKISNDIKEQTGQVLENLEAIIKESGVTLKNIVRCGIFLKNMDDFAAVNEIYGQFFSTHKPTRSCVEVSRLPQNVLIEIEAVVLMKEKQ